MASPPNPRLRERIELIIRVAGPLLDLTLAAGGVVSRLLTREDADYVPARMAPAGETVPRALRPRP